LVARNGSCPLATKAAVPRWLDRGWIKVSPLIAMSSSPIWGVPWVTKVYDLC
jgi:hypothetical protein